MSSEKFCLRWNDFEKNISSAFRELHNDKDFFDVTIACDDEQMQAHKVILSACSPFFHNILRRNPHQHPLLYLKGVKHTDLQSVINFMYHGEVNVAQEELNAFLAVAEDLKVKGLTQNQPGESKKKQSLGSSYPKTTHLSRKPPTSVPEQEPPPPPIQSFRVDPPVPAPYLKNAPEDDDIQEVACLPIKSEPILHTTHHPAAVQEGGDGHSLDTYQEDSQGFDDFGQFGDDQQYAQTDTSQRIEEVHGSVSSPDDLYQFCARGPGQSKWRCSICSEYTNNGRNHVRNHVESKHFPNTFQYQCPQCDKTCNTKKGLDVHKSERHRNI